MAKMSVYDVITDCIIKRLEAGVVPWHRPWKTFGDPANLISGKPYRGINWFLLSLVDHVSPYWLTFKQAKELGGHVKKGERAMPCVFWKQWETEDKDTGETIEIPILRYYRVFNTDQCEGIDHKRLKELTEPMADNHFDPITEADGVIDTMPKRPSIRHEGTRAFYRPSTDIMNVPDCGLFESAEAYYSTFFHELGHSTGHESRLRRKSVEGSAFFGGYEYGQEELVAEMTAAYLCSHCHIDQPTIDNSASYIGSWLQVIRKDSKLVVIAAAQAQKAADFILGKGESVS